MSELKVNTLESNNTLTANSLTVGDVTVNSIGITAPTYVVNTSAIAIGNSSANITITANSSIPSINIGGTTYTSLSTETVNTQLFTANGTWTKPSWATDGKELVIVHMWGGGGGGAVNAPGGGGAFVFGYFIANNVGATQSVTVGTAGANGNPRGANGGVSTFSGLSAYGGGGGSANGSLTPTVVSGGGGGWFSTGGNTSTDSGGGPLGGTFASPDSTFGGGSGANATVSAGSSIYGGGGGEGFSVGSGGNSVFGGGGGGMVTSPSNTGGVSIFGGNGGSGSNPGFAPAGGGGTLRAGARGEVRVYTLRILS